MQIQNPGYNKLYVQIQKEPEEEMVNGIVVSKKKTDYVVGKVLETGILDQEKYGHILKGAHVLIGGNAIQIFDDTYIIEAGAVLSTISLED